jgi:hypothetical protein
MAKHLGSQGNAANAPYGWRIGNNALSGCFGLKNNSATNSVIEDFVEGFVEVLKLWSDSWLVFILLLKRRGLGSKSTSSRNDNSYICANVDCIIQ